MTASRSIASTSSVRPFIFESFGVVVKIDGNVQEIIDDGEKVARTALLNWLRPANGQNVSQVFELRRNKSSYALYHNGEGVASCRGKKKFLKFFDGIIRITVGENAVDRVFLHAGAVGWKGRGVVLPAESFAGKSTLVAELVRQGADYYSDDFAILDKDGMLYPFPRIISMRTDDGVFRPYDVPVESLGGVAASKPLPVGMVLFTEYEAGQKWKPAKLSAGQGVLQMIPFVLPMRRAPELSMQALKSVASHAIIVKSRRGSAKEFAELILNFVDKNAN